MDKEHPKADTGGMEAIPTFGASSQQAMGEVHQYAGPLPGDEATLPAAGLGDPGFGEGDSAAQDGDQGGFASEGDPQVPSEPGKAPYNPPKTIPEKAIGRALRAAGGNIALAAEALGIAEKSMYARISKSRQLDVVFGGPGQVEDPQPPTAAQVENRGPRDVPKTIMAQLVPDGPEAMQEKEEVTIKANVEVECAISQEDKERFYHSLHRYGISENTLNGLRALDGLAPSTGKRLAISMQTTHQALIGQLFKMMQVGIELQESMKGVAGPDGKPMPMDPETYLGYVKAYTELSKEIRMGTLAMHEIGESVTRMLIAASNIDLSKNGKKAQASWGPKAVK